MKAKIGVKNRFNMIIEKKSNIIILFKLIDLSIDKKTLDKKLNIKKIISVKSLKKVFSNT